RAPRVDIVQTLEADFPAAQEADAVLRQEIRLILDEEIERLPERYRLPVILCYLHGLTNEEAARCLGCPKGTVSVRLMRARERLRGRVPKRGLGVAAALFTAVLGREADTSVPDQV